jgi:membrane protein YqaA with SNARE-associated domain
VNAVPPFTPSARRRHTAYIIIALVAAVAGVAFLVTPQHKALIGYALYAIPSHLVISFLPHEPAQLFVAKLYPPALIATVGVTSCAAAAVIDYWLIGWVMSQQLVRSRFDNWRPYQIAERIFKKAPFLLIVGSAFAPVPFYPAKILAIASDYPLSRFVTGMAVGRWPRFYLLAIGGQKVQAPNSLLLWAAISLAVLGLFQIWRTRRKNRLASKTAE